MPLTWQAKRLQDKYTSQKWEVEQKMFRKNENKAIRATRQTPAWFNRSK